MSRDEPKKRKLPPKTAVYDLLKLILLIKMTKRIGETLLETNVLVSSCEPVYFIEYLLG